MNLCECELPEKTLRKVGNDIVLQSVAGIFLFLAFLASTVAGPLDSLAYCLAGLLSLEPIFVYLHVVFFSSKIYCGP